MPDREKVLTWLEICGKNRDCSGNCPYSGPLFGEDEASRCRDDLMADALALLEEHEPVKAVADGEDSYRCTNCGTVIGWDEWEPGGIEEVKYKFCPECGRSVKWNE